MVAEYLTREQLDAYERDGFLLLESLYAPGEIAEMTGEADRLIELTINSALPSTRLALASTCSAGTES